VCGDRACHSESTEAPLLYSSALAGEAALAPEVPLLLVLLLMMLALLWTLLVVQLMLPAV